jgi:GNAT superfamily N-acetyltransferase
VVTDLALSRRLERAEATAGAAFVESRARLVPARGAAWVDVAGTYAMFDGVGSPVTQTFGLGLFEPARAADLDALEGFFAERGADVNHEVSPLADPALLALLPARGYRPVELTSVMHRPLGDDDRRDAGAPGVSVRVVGPGEEDVWARTAAAGWAETPEAAAFLSDFGGVGARSRATTCFLAEIDGAPVAAAMLAVHAGVAVLAGASTVPAWRGRGAQGALLRARLAHAASIGCDLAMMGAAPGSASQRNGERAGFRIAYTRIKWGRPHGTLG